MKKLIIMLALATAGAHAAAQVPDVLDLTQPRRAADTPSTSGPVTGSASGLPMHAPREPLNVRVKLESLDKDSYRLGEPFVLRVSLQNLGASDVLLPWEPDRERVLTGPDAPLIEALLVLDLDAAGSRQSIPIALLYGSTASTAQHKRLGKNDKVEIVASGTWTLPAPKAQDTAAQDSPGSTRVTAVPRLMFLTSVGGHVYADLRAENPGRVIVTKPNPR